MTSAQESRLSRDFTRLWLGLGVSQFGSAIGSVALPVVAVTLLDASTGEVALLAVIATATSALCALPLGSAVEFRRKRPMMIAADVLRFVTMLSVPIAHAVGIASVGQLFVVASLNALGQVTFASASQANLVNLVSRRRLAEANGRLQSTNWAALSVGPSLGGILVGAAGAATTLLIDAASFLASAFAVWRMREPEPVPPGRDGHSSRWQVGMAGIAFVWKSRVLRTQFLSWIVFAGCVGLSTPLSTILYLRVLGLSAAQYGIILGVPSLAGALGALLSGRLVARYGLFRTLLTSSFLRAPWPFVVPFLAPGRFAVVLATASFAGLLFFSSVANSAMTSYRQTVTPDDVLSRVATAWQLGTSLAQPMVIAVGGLLATWLGVREVLFLAASGMAAASLLLAPLKRER